MALNLFTNNARTHLASSILIGATTLTVTAGTGALFPSPGAGQQFAIDIIDAADGRILEICYVTARATDAFTIVRAREGTTARAWPAGSTIEERLTAAQLAQFEQFGETPSGPTYWAAGGTPNALTITPDPAYTSYKTGMAFLVKIASDNTGPATLNVNGLGPKNIKDQTGAALVASSFVAGRTVLMVYTAAGQFELAANQPISSFVEVLPDIGSLVNSDDVLISSGGVLYKSNIGQLTTALAENNFVLAYFLGMF